MLTDEQLAIYRRTKQKRAAEQRRLVEARRELGWRVAREAAAFLRQTYSVTRVVLFGSLVSHVVFHHRSDVDLAVWGLAERDYYRAVGQLQALEPTISVDLVRIEEARPTLIAVVEAEGQVL